MFAKIKRLAQKKIASAIGVPMYSSQWNPTVTIQKFKKQTVSANMIDDGTLPEDYVEQIVCNDIFEELKKYISFVDMDFGLDGKRKFGTIDIAIEEKRE